jgi:hypothetical protein
MASTRYVSDNARANWSALAGVAAGTGAVLLAGAERDDPTSFAVVTYLAFWPVFVVVYLVWTHRPTPAGAPVRSCRAAGASRSSAVAGGTGCLITEARPAGPCPRPSSPWS